MTNDLFILVYQYSDNSATHICGVTSHLYVAKAWIAAGGGRGEHKVFLAQLDEIAPAHKGLEEWKPE